MCVCCNWLCVCVCVCVGGEGGDQVCLGIPAPSGFVQLLEVETLTCDGI